MTPRPRTDLRNMNAIGWGGVKQPARKGTTNPGPSSQSGSGDGSNTLQREKDQRLMGWQYSKMIVPCYTPDNKNGLSDPSLKKLAQGEAMTSPRNKGAKDTLPHPQLTEIPEQLGECISQDVLLVKDLW